LCPVCDLPLASNENTEVHHIIPKKMGGGDELSNLIVLHKECHKQVTFTKSKKINARFVELGVLKSNKLFILENSKRDNF